MNNFITQTDMERYYSLFRKLNGNDRKDLLKKINDSLTKEEQQFIIKNTKSVKLQGGFDYWREEEDIDISGYPANKIIISKSQKKLVEVINNTGSDDIDDIEDIEDYLRFGATYAGYESFLIYNGYNVLHAYRDARGDWGTGFMIIVSEKDGKINLHTPFITYNNYLENVKIEEDMLSFDTKEDMLLFLDKLIIDINDIYINGNMSFFDYDTSYEKVSNKFKNKYQESILKDEKTFNVTSQIFWSSAFFEYPEETLLAMKHITSIDGGYYDNQSLIDFRLYGKNRFDEYDGDIIIEIVD